MKIGKRDCERELCKKGGSAGRVNCHSLRGVCFWDNWLVWNALDSNHSVIDASAAVLAVHQNHDYGYHPQGKLGVFHDAEARRNSTMESNVAGFYCSAHAASAEKAGVAHRKFAAVAREGAAARWKARMSAPYFTVLIDSYNYGHYVEEAVSSVLAQDFPIEEREILVVDDGSTDDTAWRLRRFGNAIRYLRKPNGGQASAFNCGFARTARW